MSSDVEDPRYGPNTNGRISLDTLISEGGCYECGCRLRPGTTVHWKSAATGYGSSARVILCGDCVRPHIAAQKNRAVAPTSFIAARNVSRETPRRARRLGGSA